MNANPWPQNVGIVAIEMYVPHMYVDQAELEEFDKVGTGKYTKGLGQERMAFCGDNEDINSICMTVLSRLLERTGVSVNEIGRLEVGTETLADTSKSTKTWLMDLFGDNKDVIGTDCRNACYGGTCALFNAIDWLESSSWDGRYAVVIAADMAEYESGPARPTGGCGAVALLLGVDAPLVLERGVRASYFYNVFDFYKPTSRSAASTNYPLVDGRLSLAAYAHSIDCCYRLYRSKQQRVKSEAFGSGGFTLRHADATIFHSPYTRLVHKVFSRLLLHDLQNDSDSESERESLNSNVSHNDVEALRKIDLDANPILDRDAESKLLALADPMFRAKCEQGLFVAKQVGNMYTASLYGCLVSHLIKTPVEKLAGQRVVLFSYGSGAASSMFSLTIRRATDAKWTLDALTSRLHQFEALLDARIKISPSEYNQIMAGKESSCRVAPFEPKHGTEKLAPHTWYLQRIDDQHRRFYARTS